MSTMPIHQSYRHMSVVCVETRQYSLSLYTTDQDSPNLRVCRVEKVNERCRDDHTGSEVACKEVDTEWNLEPSDTLCSDRKESDTSRDDQDDEESRDACAQLAIVVVAGCIQSTNDLSWICCVEVDIGWVKVCSRTRTVGSHLGMYKRLTKQSVQRENVRNVRFVSWLPQVVLMNDERVHVSWEVVL